MFAFGIILIIVSLFFIAWAVYLFSDDSKLGGLIVTIIALLILAGGIASIIFGMNSESFKRWQKDLESNYSGGLNRVIQVVDQNGNVIREYKGKMDIQENSGDKIVFVMDGKKYIIYNTSIFNTVFVEETGEE